MLPDRAGRFSVFELVKQVDLLRGIEIGEKLAVKGAGGLVDTGQSQTITCLQVFVGSAKLTVDVVDDTGPGGSGILVGRDDLIDHRGKRAGFVDAEKAPRAAIAAASYGRASRGRRNGGGLEEGAAVELGKKPHSECSDVNDTGRVVEAQ